MAAPSVDKIGRTFPAVIATALQSDALPTSGSTTLLGIDRFLQEAATVFDDHSTSETDSLWQAVQQIPPPSEAEITEAGARSVMLLQNARARLMEDSCFSEPDDRYYAYNTLRLATLELPPPQARVLLCPTGGKAENRAFWAEAISQSTQGTVPVPMMWLDSPEHEAFLAGLGSAPQSMLRFLLDQPDHGQTLWPLRTTHESAREQAKNALDRRNFDGPGQTFSNLLHEISRIQL